MRGDMYRRMSSVPSARTLTKHLLPLSDDIDSEARRFEAEKKRRRVLLKMFNSTKRDIGANSPDFLADTGVFFSVDGEVRF